MKPVLRVDSRGMTILQLKTEDMAVVLGAFHSDISHPFDDPDGTLEYYRALADTLIKLFQQKRRGAKENEKQKFDWL